MFLTWVMSIWGQKVFQRLKSFVIFLHSGTLKSRQSWQEHRKCVKCCVIQVPVGKPMYRHLRDCAIFNVGYSVEGIYISTQL